MADQTRQSDAYAADPEPRRSRRLRLNAQTFKPDPQLEQLLALPEDQRAPLLTGNPTLRTSLAMYVESKAAAEQWHKENPQ